MHEPAGRALRVDGHPADGIHGEPVMAGLALGERREDLDRFPNISGW